MTGPGILLQRTTLKQRSGEKQKSDPGETLAERALGWPFLIPGAANYPCSTNLSSIQFRKTLWLNL